MKLSLNWLKEYVKFKEKPEQVAEIFRQGGFEAEDIKVWGQEFAGIVIGQIKTIISHAEANKLSVCKVDIGRTQLLTIVCGADNIKPGQKVPTALVDTILPNGMKIERRRIRGIDSDGMLCAEDELGLGKDHSGIMILDDSLKIGQKFSRATGLDDTVLDLTVLPNRPDAYSVIGLAREYAALVDYKYLNKKIAVPESKKYSVKKLLTIKVADYNLCPKYTARVVKHVTIGPSPQWLQARLTVSGVKPINNIVDISNYVMLEYGQPLHVFDLDKLQGHSITVRKAGTEKSFVTLDGVTRTLASDMLMIADGKQSIAVAGVMGGDNSEVSKQTKDIVIESAIFKPVSIRKTRQRLGLMTEASIRFEKGIYWQSPELACDRAAQLMHDLAGGEVASGMIVAAKEKATKQTTVKVNLDYINKIIGRTFKLAEVKKMLARLNFKVTDAGKGVLNVVAPYYRQDINIPADVVEEVGRMHGWNKIKPTPIYGELKPVTLSREKIITGKLKDELAAHGLTEVYNYSFYNQAMAMLSGVEVKKHYAVKNPINPEQAYMRTSLLPRMLDNILKQYQENESIGIFEVGHVYHKSTKELPNEKIMVSTMVYSKIRREGMARPIQQIKGLLENLFGKFNLFDTVSYELEDSRKTNIILNNKSIGSYGWITGGSEKLGLPPVYFEFDLGALVKADINKVKYQMLSEFPGVSHDFTFITPADVKYGDIVREISNADELVTSVAGTKIYQESDKKRSVTFKIGFQSSAKTLVAEDIAEVRNKVIKALANKFKMELKR